MVVREMKREREKEREEKTIRLNVGERYGATVSESVVRHGLFVDDVVSYGHFGPNFTTVRSWNPINSIQSSYCSSPKSALEKCKFYS